MTMFNKQSQQQPQPINRLLTPKEAARILGVSPETLNVWRTTKRYNLPYIKTGRLVRYQRSDIDAFITRNTKGKR